MNFGYAFSYQFQDPDWIKKILLNGLITLIPLVGPIYMTGWLMEIAGRFATQDTVMLPDIDFGRYLSKGFMGAITGLIYSLPGVIVMMPAIIISALVSGERGMEWLVIVSMVCCLGLGILLSIALSLLSMVAIVEVQLKDFKAAFQIKHVFSIFKGAIGPYLLTVLVVGLVVPILSSLGGLLCGIGVLFTVPYSMTMYGSMLGQAHKTGSSKLLTEI